MKKRCDPLLDSESMADCLSQNHGLLNDPRTPLSPLKFFKSKMFFTMLWQAMLWGSVISPFVSFIMSGGLERPADVLESWAQHWKQIIWAIPSIGMIWAFFLSTSGVLFRYSMVPYLEKLKNRVPIVLSVSVMGFTFGFVSMLLILYTALYVIGVRTFNGEAFSQAGIAGFIGIGVGQILYSNFLNEVLLWETKIRAEELVRHKLEGELMNLNMRIRPHFFFNSLNTLASLIDKSPAQAQEFLADLSDLFRQSFTHGQNNSWCRWEEERALIESYLSIEKSRFGDKLNWVMDVNLDPKTPFPAFLMQPIVENAVKHGMALPSDIVVISIEGERKGRYLELVIENPMPENHIVEVIEGHSLHSITERIQLLGGQLEIQNHTDRVSVRLSIPFENKP